jgi:hypothetical protein
MTARRQSCIHFFAGEDFTIDNITTLTFGPDDRDLPVPFSILGDVLPEEEESFRLFLSINESKNGLSIGENFTTLIGIIDNDSEFNMTLLLVAMRLPLALYVPTPLCFLAQTVLSFPFDFFSGLLSFSSVGIPAILYNFIGMDIAKHAVKGKLSF